MTHTADIDPSQSVEEARQALLETPDLCNAYDEARHPRGCTCTWDAAMDALIAAVRADEARKAE